LELRASVAITSDIVQGQRVLASGADDSGSKELRNGVRIALSAHDISGSPFQNNHSDDDDRL